MINSEEFHTDDKITEDKIILDEAVST